MSERLFDAHTVAVAFYRDQLGQRPGGWAATHLRDRGLGGVLAAGSGWSVGYAPDRLSQLVDHLRRSGFDDEVIVAAGLAWAKESGFLIDRFRDRIMFVAHDRELRPVGFVGRSQSVRVRYLNTRTTEIFSKAQTLVGLDSQVDRLQTGAIPVFVEGPLDAVAVALAGREWAGAACNGTAISQDQALITRKHSRTGAAIVALDGDVAGRRGAVRSLRRLSEVFDEVYVARLPGGDDPASLYAADRRSLREVLSSVYPLVDFAIEVELAKWANVLDHLSGQVNAVRAVAPLIASLPPRRVAHAIGRLAMAVDLDEQIVSSEVLDAVDRADRWTSRRHRSSPSDVGAEAMPAVPPPGP